MNYLELISTESHCQLGLRVGNQAVKNLLQTKSYHDDDDDDDDDGDDDDDATDQCNCGLHNSWLCMRKRTQHFSNNFDVPNERRPMMSYW